MRGLVVFDLDGTLVDTLGDLTATANRLLAWRAAPSVTLAEVRPMIGDGIAALVRRLIGHTGLKMSESEAIERFTGDYERNAANSSHLFAGAAETLSELRETGWELAVCTNKPQRAAEILLEHLGIAHLMACIGGGDRFARRKPDPAHLLGTIALSGGSAARSIMVGDHRNDIEAAKSASVNSIFALWGYGSEAMAETASARAAAITEIPAMADSMLRGAR